MKYLSVGTNYIGDLYFQKIQNGNGFKPYGGLWATKQEEGSVEYNEWIDYLCQHPYLLFYKGQNNMFNQPAVFLTLKNNANIFNIDDQRKIDFIIKKYPDNHGWINYEKLSKDYDGIYIDLSKIENMFQKETIDKLQEYCVSTLVLFNSSCISYYQKACVEFETTDIYDYRGLRNYFINIEPTKYHVDQKKEEEILLLNKMTDFIKSQKLESNKENQELVVNKFNKEINNCTVDNDLQRLILRKVFN